MSKIIGCHKNKLKIVEVEVDMSLKWFKSLNLGLQFGFQAFSDTYASVKVIRGVLLLKSISTDLIFITRILK